MKNLPDFSLPPLAVALLSFFWILVLVGTVWVATKQALALGISVGFFFVMLELWVMKWDLKLLRAQCELLELRSESEDACCIWRHEMNDATWRTSCGGQCRMEEGKSMENQMRYCPYCGRRLKEITE